jgi:osmotically-inducible protein OsmY
MSEKGAEKLGQAVHDGPDLDPVVVPVTKKRWAPNIQARDIPGILAQAERREAMAEKKDEELAQAVRDELDFDPAVAVRDRGVSGEHGEVTLTGIADTLHQSWDAERAAWRVRGVRGVINEIVIAPPAQPPDDRAIAQAVAAALALDSDVPPARINVDVIDGTVTLTGTVEWQHQAAAAERAARMVPGIRGVTSVIAVTPPEASAAQISERIARAFARNAALADDHVEVIVEGGHVLLLGTVRTHDERHEAGAIAWRSPGVTSVSNQIFVAA